MSNKKPPKIFYFIIPIIPVLLITILELSLLIFDYGKDLSQWYNITPEKLILNPEIGGRYFNNIKNYPHSNHDSFYEEKKENTLRIFVFGGSSTAGFPYQPNGSFSRYLSDRLQFALPDKTIEVINLGITAVNTYTIKDLLPGVIEQNPDGVIIYAGHNEYYGALGVGSTQSIGNSQFLINTYLYLKKFRTTQLITNVLQSFSIILASNKKAEGSTLMARMASEKAISFESEIYNEGVEQFSENLEYILRELKLNNIPIFVGTLISKTKDQVPFISTSQKDYQPASTVYKSGIEALEKNELLLADSLLSLAKNLDGLRFRAPSLFNTIIKKLSIKHNAGLVDIEDFLKSESKDGIIGNSLMVDHLHPNLEGHFKIGKLFYEKMVSSNLLKATNIMISNTNAHNKVTRNFNFSELDSASSNYRIYNLLNDWPFVKKKSSNTSKKYFDKSFIDSLGFRIVNENLNWEIAHQKAYQYYLKKNDIKNFVKELMVLISQYPYKLKYYNYAARELIQRKEYEHAVYFLNKRYKFSPDDFTTKWLGNINLSNNSIPEAINYFNESIQFNPNDAQVFYNLAVAYIKSNNMVDALENVRKCIKIKPNLQKALSMEKQIMQKLKKPTN